MVAETFLQNSVAQRKYSSLGYLTEEKKHIEDLPFEYKPDAWPCTYIHEYF